MSDFPHHYVINVMSNDHPGIVAAVSDAVESLGGNIDACSQTVLGGYFTLIMIISVPEPIESDLLAENIRGRDSRNAELQVMVLPSRHALPKSEEPCEQFVVTAFGKDRPGIVRCFSEYLAGKDINIVDLYGDLKGTDPKGDEFVLIGQVEVPVRYDTEMLQADLEAIGKDLGFTVKLQHENIFVATNQLRLAATHK